MDTLIYFGKVNLYWIMLYACYWLMLRNHTFFKWNRFYLLGSLCIAFTLPLIIYPETAPTLPVNYEITAADFTFAPTENVEKPLMTWPQIIWLIYGIGFSIATYHLAYHILQLKKFLNAGEIIDLDDCKVVLIDSNHIGSFSFLKWIVINRSDYENHFDSILRHEMVHTHQWHSLDILFTEVMKVVFWFNPVLPLYKRSFQEVHEFLADEQAPNREHYAKFLVAYALHAPVASLTNHFFKPSQIKSRIQMIYKHRTSKWLLSTYLIAFSLIGFAALIIAGCERKENDQPIAERKALGKEAIADKKIFTVVEEQPKFPGGNKAMFKFLGDHLKYPEKAVKSNITGRVFLSFVVTENGEIADIQVLKGLGYGCDEEAIRVLSQFPKWEPGKQGGIPVNVRYNLPINFQIEDETGANKGTSKSGLVLKTNDGKKPLMIVNGKVMSTSDLAKVNTANIKSVKVLKDDYALVAYGDKGKNGVLEIEVGDAPAANTPRTDVTISDDRPAMNLQKPAVPDQTSSSLTQLSIKSSLSTAQPLVIIDGIKQEQRGSAAYEHLNRDVIKTISVVKNPLSNYGAEGRDGVVYITTKK
ncbi:M56 family metallopeptidase [Dyadobacter arcticus]|uniref:TonB family protein n=1 Tax=Dyadobacter arcticus TaxID=1078754 RepID=A0ABX0UQT3_9BACT|nr:M56 family metallopeptidase [Dyadobacter arcticus]NIJ55354.1 TonB family protein [Dyadobacter arcticus]